MASIMVGNGDWVAFFERSWQCASFGMLTDILRQLWRVHTIKNHVFTLFLDYFLGFLALMVSIMVGNGVWVAFYERSGQCASFSMLTDILFQLGCVHTTKNDIFSR